MLEALRWLNKTLVNIAVNALGSVGIALKKHSHNYLPAACDAPAAYRLEESRNVALREHEHPYVANNPFRLKNASSLDGRTSEYFAKRLHNHDDTYQKPKKLGVKKYVESARSFDVGGVPFSPRTLFSLKEHDHREYFRFGERVFRAQKLEGRTPSEIASRDHTHDYVRQNSDRYHRKDTIAYKAKRLTRGIFQVLQGSIISGSVSRTISIPDANMIGYEMFAKLVGKDTANIENMFKVYSSSSLGCLDFLDHICEKTKYAIVFMSPGTYKKLQPVLYRAGLYMGTNPPPLDATIQFPFSIVDAEGRGQSISSYVAAVKRTSKFWLPLVPPKTGNSPLSFIDHIIFMIGTLFLVVVSAISYIVSALIITLINAIAQIPCKLAGVWLIGGLFQGVCDFFRNLCRQFAPIAQFRVLDGGAAFPMVFVQIREGNAPRHWLAPDRAYGVTVIPQNVYAVINKHRISMSGTIMDLAGVAGGYFSDLDSAVNTYCRRFSAQWPVMFINARGVDGTNVYRYGDVYVARYVKPFDPRRVKFGAMGAGSEIIMFNHGLPYTIVCIIKETEESGGVFAS